MQKLFSKNGIVGQIGRLLCLLIFIVSLATPFNVSANTPTPTGDTVFIQNAEFNLSNQVQIMLDSTKNEKLDFVLSQVAAISKISKVSALNEAKNLSLNISGDLIQVQITIKPEHYFEVISLVKQNNGIITKISQDKTLLQLIPLKKYQVMMRFFILNNQMSWFCLMMVKLVYPPLKDLRQ